MMLFAFFGLWTTTLGVGAGAIAIPVIIHLINRRRFKIVPWAAMKFLLQAQKQTRKRMRIEQLLLLLCRMAILGLIVFAMASVMEWAETVWQTIGIAQWGPAVQKRSHRIHHVFVLDASLSMNQKVNGDRTAFENARQQILRKIADSPSGDGFSVLVLKDSPTWLVGEASLDTRKVMREVEAVRPSHGNSSASTALSMISSKLTEAGGRFPAQAVYFFTDMQQSTWQAIASAETRPDADGKEKTPYLDIQDKATTVFVDCGPNEAADNLAITNLEFKLEQTPYVTTDTDLTLVATVHNFGKTQKKDVRAELFVGRVKDAAGDAAMQMRFQANVTHTIDADANKATAKAFVFENVRFDKAGTYAVQVRLPDDVLNQDNMRTIIITVRKTIPVLLVNGKSATDRFERATEYLRLALNPFKPGEEPAFAAVRPKVVTPVQFSEMSAAELEPYDCIYWCDVGGDFTFKQNDVSKLDAHVRRGGGFIVTLGDKALEKRDLYNDLLHREGHGLLPAKLVKRVDAPADHHFYMQNSDEAAYKDPPLEAFSDKSDRLTLNTARFRQFVHTVTPEGKANTVLAFMPDYVAGEKTKRDTTLPVNLPAIIEWSPLLARVHQPASPRSGQRLDRRPARYRGKVILFTSTVNMDWNSWPGSPSYGAMVHELTRLAVSGRLREQSQQVGGVLDAFLPGGGELEVTMKYPEDIKDIKPGKVRTQLIDEVNVFRWGDTDFAGIYLAETTTGHEIPFAVNTPSASADLRGYESDLARIDETKLKDSYPGWTFQIVRDVLTAVIGGGPVNPDSENAYQPVGPFLANVALLMVLGLMFIEIVLAFLFGHYTTTQGALSQATPSQTATLIAAVVAVLSVIVVGVGAFVMAHHHYTRDFLGFLPEIVRALFEQMMGIKPPIAGEAPNWKLEQSSFLFGVPGPEMWYAVLITIGAVLMIFFTYKAEAPRVPLGFKLLLGCLRFCLILTTLWFLLPRHEIQYGRMGFPDVVLLIDDTRSMGESDTFQDKPVIEKVEKLSKGIREKLDKQLDEKIAALKVKFDEKEKAGANDPDIKAEAKALEVRLEYWTKQKGNLKSGKWRPSRLQLVQAILEQPEPHWLKTLLTKHKTKVHIFHLDADGRAVKLRDAKGKDAGELIDASDVVQLERTAEAIGNLEPIGNDSRLGTAVRQVVDHYRGSSLSSVIMFTDGVTTRDETLSQAAEYAGSRGVSLFFIGVGDENEQRDLKILSLDVDDPIYLGDTAVFEVKIAGHGFKDLTVPVILKLLDEKTGKEKEVTRELAKVDPSGRAVRVRLRYQPKEKGRKTFIVEIEPPKLEPNEKPIPAGNLKVKKTIEVIDIEVIRVLYVEGQPRYEFRYLKFLLEREAPAEKGKEKKKSVELSVLLLDSDLDFHKQDATAIEHFPPTLDELNKYNVLIMGDCDPTHKKLRDNLKNIVAYVNGEDATGKKSAKPGGGLLFIAGAFHNPHHYKGTPLEKVLPIEPTQDNPPAETPHVRHMSPELTQAGRMHPIFRFGSDEAQNAVTWSRLAPMYWFSTKYRPKPLAEVLAVHGKEDAEVKDREGNTKHPLVVQQHVGTGRSMFFGFDETWRWRKGDDESKFITFWVQTLRYLSRGRSARAELKLDKQLYKVGEVIKVTTRFPEPTGGNQKQPKLDAKTEVKITVEYLPPDAKDKAVPDSKVIPLTKSTESRWTYEGKFPDTREGKYKFRLTHPDWSEAQPDGQNPSAEAVVEPPLGELDRLRMDYQEMQKAASLTPHGDFFTLANADRVLEVLPEGIPNPIASGVPPTLLWNQWWVFVLIVLLISSEWVLRKMKHLL